MESRAVESEWMVSKSQTEVAVVDEADWVELLIQSILASVCLRPHEKNGERSNKWSSWEEESTHQTFETVNQFSLIVIMNVKSKKTKNRTTLSKCRCQFVSLRLFAFNVTDRSKGSIDETLIGRQLWKCNIADETRRVQIIGQSEEEEEEEDSVVRLMSANFKMSKVTKRLEMICITSNGLRSKWQNLKANERKRKSIWWRKWTWRASPLRRLWVYQWRPHATTDIRLRGDHQQENLFCRCISIRSVRETELDKRWRTRCWTK